MIEDLVIDLGVDQLAPVFLRDRSDGGLIALGQPPVGSHCLGKWAARFLSEVQAVAVHGVEQPSSLILLGLDSRECRELSFVVTFFDDCGTERDDLGAVALNQFQLGCVEPEFVEPAKAFADAPRLVHTHDIGSSQLGPEIVIANLEHLGQLDWVDPIAQLAERFEFEEAAGDVVSCDHEIVRALSIRKSEMAFARLGIYEVGNQAPRIPAEQGVAERAVSPEEAGEVDTHQKHGERIDQPVVHCLATRSGEQVQVGKREREVACDENGFERLASVINALVCDPDQVDDGKALFLQEGEKLELSICKIRRKFLQSEIAAVMLDESDDMAVPTSWEADREFLRPRVEWCAPREVEEIGLGLVGRLQPQSNHVGDAIGQTVKVSESSPELSVLPDAADVSTPTPFAGPDHPMRKLTRQVAFDGAWDSTRAGKVAELFDSMAAEWSATHVDPTKAAPINDALERGMAAAGGRWLELGSGTGAGTRVLSGRVGSLVAFDLAAEMLAHAPGELAPRVRGDASTLPFGDNAFDSVLMVNMLLFPGEVDRVLAPGGTLLWVNTLGDQTPIHLPPVDVMAALPGSWEGVTANAGTGLWAALRRSGKPS